MEKQIDINKVELWQLWKMKYEQLALLVQVQQNLAALDAEIAKREEKAEVSASP